MTDSSTGLLLMGHGTRSEAGVEQCRALARKVEGLFPGRSTALGFIEFAQPNLAPAIDGLVDAGTTTVVGVPLVLLGAGHLKLDGPQALDAARKRHPGVNFRYGRDLGIHPAVLEVAQERVVTAVGLLGKNRNAGVVLVGRGSTDPDANADLYKVSRLLSDSRGLGSIEPGFVSLAVPSVTEALERCRLLGFRQVAVVPYFLFTGELVQRIGRQATAWAHSHPEMEVAVGSEMGPDDRLARVVLERFEEAISGGASMNCDCCIYRVPLPGYEHRCNPHPGGGLESTPGERGGDERGSALHETALEG